MKTHLTILSILLVLIVFVTSCKKKDESNPANDSDLWALANQAGFTYYTGTPTISAGLGNSPHGFERVRFNVTAQAALDGSGKLPMGGTFPTGSVIVKEIYSSVTGPLHAYAVMKKDPSSDEARNGYQWAEFNADGSVLYSTGKKGAACTSCHSGSTNRDFLRSFDLH